MHNATNQFLPVLKRYFWGIIKRLYWLLPSLLADPFDVTERWFNLMYTAPPYLVWILVGIGFLIASFLTYRELYIESKVELAKKSKPTVLREKSRLSPDHIAALADIEQQMEKVHGHSDYFGLAADLRDGVLASDLMERSCIRCGKPRNQKGDKTL